MILSDTRNSTVPTAILLQIAGEPPSRACTRINTRYTSYADRGCRKGSYVARMAGKRGLRAQGCSALGLRHKS